METNELPLDSKPNKYEIAEIEFIQQEIQRITKMIEHEKISLRIAKERYEKKFAEYSQLEGRPVLLSKEQKEREHREKIEKMKIRKIYDQLASKEKNYSTPCENTTKINKESSKCELELEFITKEINQQLRENKDLTNLIEDLRKEKTRVNNQLSQLSDANKKLEADMQMLIEKNQESASKIQTEEYGKSKEDGIDLQREFIVNRDSLEGKYHEIIETTIKRERDHKKEQAKKRQLLGMIAESVKPNSKGGANSIQDQLKQLENEDICDRTPILDVLVEKWKYVTKFKKNMIEKYIRNFHAIREAFYKMMLYLRVDSYSDLPIVYEKMEEQTASIEIYISSLLNDVNKLEDTKELLKEQINSLRKQSNLTKNEKESYTEMKQAHINKLQINNEELCGAMDKKRDFFLQLQAQTLKFLTKMQGTYLSEYVPQKITFDDMTKFNENNVIEFLACVQDYCGLINEFDKSTQDKSSKEDMLSVNKDLDKLRNDMKNKLELFKKDNCVNDNFYVTMKNEIKTNSSFDGTIRKLADVIANQVNTGEINVQTTKKKKI